ncbi:glycosyltransferase family 4 protein [Photorhabdus temperata]|uniref:glycosyltransferase family 4 protein n=1 Tax=Photorhabdus temperata TaxID=574560 RepID=UPI0021D493B4|nr:glycosyltransferase family 4 protein [Photorhabdus temperata]MCT8346727.1 glycosyltransferase family 4 protein [Photorhabdus temperata]
MLHITSRADIGGGPQHINTLLQYVSNDIEYYIACPKQEPYWNKYKELISENNMFEIPFRRCNLTSLLSILKFCIKNNINIIHSHGKGAGVYGRLLKLFLRLKHVHTPHGINLNQKIYFKEIIYLSYEWCTSWLTDIVIFVSESEKQKAIIHNLYKKKIEKVIIPNGVPICPDNKNNRMSRASFRNNFNLGDDRIIVISMSRFDKVKNLTLVIEIAKKCQSLIFFIYGDGPEKDIVIKKIKDEQIQNVILPGVTLEPYQILPLCDIYLSTSLMEGLPLAILEAMSCQLPIVASKVTGNIDCISHGVNGYLYDLEDIDSAANFCNLLYKNPCLREIMGQQGKKAHKKKYSAELMAHRVHEFYCL